MLSQGLSEQFFGGERGDLCGQVRLLGVVSSVGVGLVFQRYSERGVHLASRGLSAGDRGRGLERGGGRGPE